MKKKKEQEHEHKKMLMAIYGKVSGLRLSHINHGEVIDLDTSFEKIFSFF